MEPVVTAATAIGDEVGFGAERLAVSVIIATYRRRELLCATVRHIQNQGHPNLEVIVVDQTEPGLGEGMDHDLLECVQYVRAAQPNLSRARNLGLDRSHGAILLFCDDDIVPCEGWIGAHARRYRDPQVMAVADVTTGSIQVCTADFEAEATCHFRAHLFDWCQSAKVSNFST